jgi:hypothetical protein
MLSKSLKEWSGRDGLELAMFKKLGLGILLLGLLSAGGCYFFLSGLTGAANEEFSRIFRALAETPESQFESLVTPEVLREGNKERTRAFLRALPAALGAFVEVPILGGNLNFHSGTNGKVVRYGGTVRFEKFTTMMNLETIDGRIRQLSIPPGPPLDAVFQQISRAPSQAGAYPEVARSFLEDFLAGRRDEAFAKLLPSTQAEWGKLGLDKKRQDLGLTEGRGDPKELGVFDDGRKDTLAFRFEREGRPFTVTVGFQGMNAGVLDVTSEM